MAVLLSGIGIFLAMAIAAVIIQVVNTIKGANDQPLFIKIATIVGIAGTLICGICALCDKTIV